jgi:hypothetical protein
MYQIFYDSVMLDALMALIRAPNITKLVGVAVMF